MALVCGHVRRRQKRLGLPAAWRELMSPPSLSGPAAVPSPLSDPGSLLGAGRRNHFIAPTLMRALALAWEAGSWLVMEAGTAIAAGQAPGPCSHSLWAVRAHGCLGPAAFVAMFVLMWFPFSELPASTCPKETACPVLTMPGQLPDEAMLCC